MCGRFSISVSKEVMIEHLKTNYGINNVKFDRELPRYNVAPDQEILAVINDGLNYRAGWIKWGLVPEFQKAKSNQKGIINAKAETLSEKPSFSKSLKTKRCIILADGFYEWKKTGGPKTPNWITLEEKKLFPMAGLWTMSTNENGTKQFTCAIITTKANDFMASIHDRMPVILSNETAKAWLNPDMTDINFFNHILIPYDSKKMQMQEVSTYVNNSKNEGIECISH